MRILLAALLSAVALSARADLSDSGNLTIGGQAVVAGTMTVQGSQFSVGGATFSVAGGSVTLGGRLNAAAAGIKWADGTTSTTAFSNSAGGASFVSTYVYIGANFTVSSSDEGVCRGTATWTSIGGIAQVSFTGVATASSGSDRPRAGFLIDGQWTAPYTIKHGAAMIDNTNRTNMAFSVPLHTALTAGTRSICLTAWRSSGSNATFNCGDEMACVLHILEWK